MPKLWRHASEPDQETLLEIASTLLPHGVVVLPTDTIYGLHCAANDVEVTARIDAIKQRDHDKPLVVIAASLTQMIDLGVIIGTEQRELLEAHWPAPLTVILPLERPIAPSKGRYEIAVRIPDLDWLRRLLHLTGPLVSTSLNPVGERPICEMDHLSDAMRERVDGILDLGFRAALASTIADLRTGPPVLIREGGFPFSQILWKTSRKTL